MEKKSHGGTQDQLEDHSRPGTNQAGKRPNSDEKTDDRKRVDGRRTPHQAHREEHSLPGTNQAGKGPGPDGER